MRARDLLDDEVRQRLAARGPGDERERTNEGLTGCGQFHSGLGGRRYLKAFGRQRRDVESRMPHAFLL
jgi:hypothetical protein